MGQDREVDVSRRDLGALLGALGAAAGLATLTGCATDASADEPGQVASEAQALMGSSVTWVDTIVTTAISPGCIRGGAGLRGITGSTTCPVAAVGGYFVPNDGGGGLFYWSTDTTAPDDGGTVIVPAGTRTGCWKRVFSGPFNVKWFGAQGDGVTADQQAIQNAINAVPASGGAVYFPPSHAPYNLTGPLATSGALSLVNKNNVALFSDGPGAAFQLAKNLSFLNLVNVTGFEMYGLRIVGTLQTDFGDAGGDNISQGPVTLSGVNGARIHHNRWENVGGYGVFIWSTNANIWVDHNEFIQTQAGVQTGGGQNITNRDLFITDNYFLGNVFATGNHVGSDDQIAIFTGVSGQVVIARNIIDKQGPTASNQATAIDLGIDNTADGSTANDLQDVSIIDNVILNVVSTNAGLARSAIAVYGDFTSTANRLNNLRISGNTIRNVNQAITIYGPNIDNTSISNNQITNVVAISNSFVEGDGISIGGVGPVSGCVIAGNTIDSPAAFGIVVNDASRLSLQGNIVRSAGIRGIQMMSVADVILQGNMVFGSRDAGCVLATYARATLIGNSFDNNGTYGLNLQGTAPSGTFIGNMLHSNATGPMVDYTTSASHRFLENPDIGSATTASNRGTVTLSGATTSANVVLGTPEPDTTYMVVLGAAPGAGAAGGCSRAYYTSKSTTGFAVNVEVAPGAGQSVSVDWRLLR